MLGLASNLLLLMKVANIVLGTVERAMEKATRPAPAPGIAPASALASAPEAPAFVPAPDPTITVTVPTPAPPVLPHPAARQAVAVMLPVVPSFSPPPSAADLRRPHPSPHRSGLGIF
jgi:hypothetical protein